MTVAEQIRQERIERHQRGEHEWQPGPYVKVYEEPGDIVLVCRCGAMTRRTIPARASAATPAVDIEAEVRRATVERIRAAVEAIKDDHTYLCRYITQGHACNCGLPEALAILDEEAAR